MSIKHIAVLFLVLLAAAVGWKLLAPALSRASADADRAPKPGIVFDNGSIRDTTTVVKPPPKGAPSPVGVLRKCTGGDQVTYTNTHCPPGMREAKLSKGTVNVVSGTKPAAPPPDAAAAGPEMTLQDKMIERAVTPR